MPEALASAIASTAVGRTGSATAKTASNVNVGGIARLEIETPLWFDRSAVVCCTCVVAEVELVDACTFTSVGILLLDRFSNDSSGAG